MKYIDDEFLPITPRMDLEVEILALKVELNQLRYKIIPEMCLQNRCICCKMEHRFNPNHDPENGQFTSGSGSSQAVAKWRAALQAVSHQ